MSNTPYKIARHVPKTLKQCLDKAAKPMLKARGFAESRLILEWPLIIGETLAAVTAPQRLFFPKGQRNNGTLTLQVAGSWAAEIAHQEPLILEKIATYFGYRAVASLKILQAPLPVAQAVKAAAAPTPPDTPLPETIAATTQAVEDESLRRALESFGKALYERRFL